MAVVSREDYKYTPNTRRHLCHWPDCPETVPPEFWGCERHWNKLPKELRNRLYATYRPGQEHNLAPNRAYIAVAQEIQDWIRNNGRRA